MTTPAPLSRFRTLVTAVFLALCGVAGSMVGRTYGAALDTTPAWAGPAILIASLGCFMVALLLLPTALRTARSKTPANATDVSS